MAGDHSDIPHSFRFLEQLPVGICITDLNFKIVFWNTLLEKWTGIKRDEMRGQKLTDVYPHLGEPKYKNRLKLVASGGPSAIFSSQLHPHIFPAPTTDGTLRTQHTTVTLEKTLDDGNKFLMFSIQDVTDTFNHLQRIKSLRKRALDEIRVRESAEIALTESESRYRLLFENSPLGIIQFDKNGHIIAANNKYSEIAGTPHEKLIGLNLLYLPDQQMSDKIKDALNGEITHYEGFYVSQLSKKENYLKIDFAPVIDENDEVIGGAAIVEDIRDRVETQRKLQEKEMQFRLMIEGSEKVFFYFHNTDNVFQYVSPSVKNVLGYDSEELVNQNFEMVVDPDHLDEPVAIVENVYKTGIKSEPYNIYTRHKDGESIILEVIETPIIEEGKVTGIQGFARDVTKRVESQEELRESRELLASINRNINEGIFRSGADYKFIYVNQAFVSIFGYDDADELIGTNLNRLFVNQMRRREIRNMLVNQEEFLNEEVKFRKQDGSHFWGLVSGNAVFNEDGIMEYFDGAINDITERKNDLEKILESEEQYRNLFQNSMVGMYRCDINDGKFLSVNIEVLKIFRYDSDTDLANQRIPIKDKDWQKIQSILYKNGSFENLEFSVVRNDGSTIWINLSAKYYREEQYFEGVVIDTTERKQAEILQDVLYRTADLTATYQNLDSYYQEIQSIVSELMPAENFYIAVLDSEKNQLTFPYFKDQYDQPFAAKTPTRGLTEYVIRNSQPMLLRQDQINEMHNNGDIDLLGAPAKVWLGVPLKTPDETIGVIVTQDYHNENAITDRDLEILTFVSQHVATAISRKITEQSIISAKEEAEAASRSKSIFLANMSHELRTPLNSIIGYTRRVLDKAVNLDERSRSALTTVRRNAQSLLTLINDILDLSKVEAGKLDYSNQKVNLNELTELVMEELEPVYSSKDISVELKKTDTLIISTDSKRLKQVLINIIGNAIKFTDEGGIEVSVEKNTGQNSTRPIAEIKVKDSGLGIPKDKLEAIFNIFEQANSDRDEARGGTGLGLSISKRLIERMNGKILVNSEEGKGSEFIIQLPI